MLSQKILSFLFHLQYPRRLPRGVSVLDVHHDPEVRRVCTVFYDKFYADNNKRFMLIGINPGRFGGGVTGLPFTDPVRLEKDCGIGNPWPKKQELSSVFMYEMMAAYGGVQRFYGDLYITSVSPLGFVKDEKNLNYYDDARLKKEIEPFVVECLGRQIEFGMHTRLAFCIGGGENYKYLLALNQKHRWFGHIEPVPHPRFIMQYRLKQKQAYIEQYVGALKAAVAGAV